MEKPKSKYAKYRAKKKNAKNIIAELVAYRQQPVPAVHQPLIAEPLVIERLEEPGFAVNEDPHAPMDVDIQNHPIEPMAADAAQHENVDEAQLENVDEAKLENVDEEDMEIPNRLYI